MLGVQGQKWALWQVLTLVQRGLQWEEQRWLKPPFRQGCSVAVGREEEPGDPRFTERAAPAQHALEFLSALLLSTVERSLSVWLSRFSLRGRVASPVHTWQDRAVTSPTRPSWILLCAVASVCGRVARCLRWGLRARWEGAYSPVRERVTGYWFDGSGETEPHYFPLSPLRACVSSRLLRAICISPANCLVLSLARFALGSLVFLPPLSRNSDSAIALCDGRKRCSSFNTAWGTSCNVDAFMELCLFLASRSGF